MRTPGFTLIEIMIVIVVVAVLAALAIPSYANYVDRARRADATSSLLSAAQRLERCYTRNNSYASCLDEGNVGFDSADGFYKLFVIVENNGTTFRLVAQPQGRQERDEGKCSEFRLNHLGEREVDGSLGNRCWS